MTRKDKNLSKAFSMAPEQRRLVEAQAKELERRNAEIKAGEEQKRKAAAKQKAAEAKKIRECKRKQSAFKNANKKVIAKLSKRTKKKAHSGR